MGLISNIDTLYASVLVEDYVQVAEALLKDLQGRLEEKFIKRSRAPEFVELGGVTFEYVNGAYSWSYGLKCTDFTLYLAHAENNANYPLYVEFRQEYLWQEGYQKAWNKFLIFLQGCGYKYLASKVSRADLCCHTDIEILKYDYLQYLHYDPRCEVHKTGVIPISDEGALVDTWGRSDNFTGIRVGKGQPLMARIYDKSEEIKVSNKVWFKRIWQQHGLDPEAKIVNIEFEIKREWFRERNIDTVEDLFEKLGSIWYYLTKNYLSFKYLDNDRRSRRTICEWWQEVRVATFEFDGSVLCKRDQVEINIDKAVSGAMGYITSYCAAIGLDHVDDRVMSQVLNAMNKMASHRDISIPDRIKQKKMRKLSPVDMDQLFDEYDLPEVPKVEYKTYA